MVVDMSEVKLPGEAKNNLPPECWPIDGGEDTAACKKTSVIAMWISWANAIAYPEGLP
jgi:hypothetical protein